jgi:hypothetical protein
VHPSLEDSAPRGVPLTYEFDDTLVVPATLYKARTRGASGRALRRYSGAFELRLATARVHCFAPAALHAVTDFLCLCHLVPMGFAVDSQQPGWRAEPVQQQGAGADFARG